MDDKAYKEIRDLTHQIKELSDTLSDVAYTLRPRSVYYRVRFWAALMAAMSMNMGVVLLVGSPSRVSASAYTYLAATHGGHLWGSAFLGCSFAVFASAWKFHCALRWALLLEALPYAALSVSFALASWRYSDANLTAAPVYGWITIVHAIMSDYARKEF